MNGIRLLANLNSNLYIYSDNFIITGNLYIIIVVISLLLVNYMLPSLYALLINIVTHITEPNPEECDNGRCRQRSQFPSFTQ